ncbi:hypothetical protein OE88DRAFT_720226 [Heliocybe sulcata]|uniref:Uncharacterized protein n=1 Tax=Heliocybe sulcata TaxID=5364 RepID=A0A5C3NEP8_9AGAM|nr:hypothetical protein OE88DRAFT_720226 [Heliocybe sulcata]
MPPESQQRCSVNLRFWPYKSLLVGLMESTSIFKMSSKVRKSLGPRFKSLGSRFSTSAELQAILGLPDERETVDMAVQTESLYCSSSMDDQMDTMELAGGRALFKPCSNFPLTRIISVAGLVISGLFGVACISLGVATLKPPHSLLAWGGYVDQCNGNLRLHLPFPFMRELLLLCLNLAFVKLAVWSAGSAHETTLRWTLAAETDRLGGPRLQYNSNLRFLQASRRWYSANGIFANATMASCLVVTYAASSMMLLADAEEGANEQSTAVISSLPPFVLGTAILLQVIIGTIGLLTTTVPIWSQSPLATARTMVEAGVLKKRRGRCMHSVAGEHIRRPLKPKLIRHSGWERHPQIGTFVFSPWFFVGTGYYLSGLLVAVMASRTGGATLGAMQIRWTNEASISGLLSALMVIVAMQGCILTAGFTMSNTLTSLTRDENWWKEAASERGSDESPGPLKTLFANWQTITVHIAEPTLHWFFGMALSLDADAGLLLRPKYVSTLPRLHNDIV